MKKVYNNKIEWVNKSKKLHRVDGPAIIFTNGHKEWYLNGKLHRVDGPAIEWYNGMKSWFLNGYHFVSEQEWFKTLAEKDQVAYLFNIGFKNDN